MLVEKRRVEHSIVDEKFGHRVRKGETVGANPTPCRTHPRDGTPSVNSEPSTEQTWEARVRRVSLADGIGANETTQVP
jgi:hypothetical protein